MISVLQLGTIDYATGLRLQEKLVDLRKEGRIGDVLLLLEHAPVITLWAQREARECCGWRRANKNRGAAWRYSIAIGAATSRSMARGS